MLFIFYYDPGVLQFFFPVKQKNKQSRRQKKLKAYDLSALSEFLPEPAAPEQKTEAKLNCKSRQTLV
jgi:hypothetical protein